MDRIALLGLLVALAVALAGCAEPSLDESSASTNDRSVAADDDGATSTDDASSERVVLEGYEFVENDMVFPKVEGQSIAATRNSKWKRWPGGVVPYVIEPGTVAPDRITRAAEELRLATGVRFVPRTNEADYVSFSHKTRRCWAQFGKQGGKQTVDVFYEGPNKWGCRQHDVLHEMLHSLGVAHEHSRADRDDHVTILWDNIKDAEKDNFEKINFQSIGEYDRKSIMHYEGSAFSKNGKPTLVARDGSAIGENSALSSKDAAGIKSLYTSELAGVRTDKKIAVTWPKKSATATYSLDVKDGAGRWVAPCLDSATLRNATATVFAGYCHSVNRYVSTSDLKAVRICWTEKEDWKAASCSEVAYAGQDRIALP